MNVIFNKSKVNGKIEITGAKNEALPILAATILTTGNVHLSNMPCIDDIVEKIYLLEKMNISAKSLSSNEYIINTNNIIGICDCNTRIRTSILIVGPLLCRCKSVKIPYPQGDKIGDRKINHHINFLQQMGASITIENDFIIANADQMNGINYHFDKISVGATQHLIMTAVIANGTTYISNASIEPETTGLCNFLIKLGYDIKGVGSSCLIIEGKNLSSENIKYQINSDRLQAFTYLIMTLVTDGYIELTGYNIIKVCSHIFDILTQLGLDITLSKNKIIAKTNNMICEDISIDTGEYPNFSTDYQPLIASALCLKANKSRVQDHIYPQRYQYAEELKKMGANIIKHDNWIEIHKSTFIGHQSVEANDIRAGAALVIAAITTNNTTIHNFYHILRGYSDFLSNLSKLNINYELVLEK